MDSTRLSKVELYATLGLVAWQAVLFFVIVRMEKTPRAVPETPPAVTRPSYGFRVVVPNREAVIQDSSRYFLDSTIRYR